MKGISYYFSNSGLFLASFDYFVTFSIFISMAVSSWMISLMVPVIHPEVIGMNFSASKSMILNLILFPPCIITFDLVYYHFFRCYLVTVVHFSSWFSANERSGLFLTEDGTKIGFFFCWTVGWATSSDDESDDYEI